jgi:outer membrane protein assembly factor BamB
VRRTLALVPALAVVAGVVAAGAVVTASLGGVGPTTSAAACPAPHPSPLWLFLPFAPRTVPADTATPAATATPPLVCSTATPTPPTPPAPPTSTGGEWSQFGHDAQRTSYTSQTVAAPWRYVWQWNGADASGRPQASHLSVPSLVQPITGGGRIYMVTTNAVYALSPSTGQVLWSNGGLGALGATPAYDSGALYVPSTNGQLYRLDASTGAISASFAATSGLNLAPLLVGGTVYVVAADGTLAAVDKGSMARLWAYAGGAAGSTPPSYSASRDVVVYVTQDLFVHAVGAADGQRRWRVKPTPRNRQCVVSGSDLCNVVDATGAQAERGWPVVADQHGVVLVKYRLDWNTLWTWSPYPTTNSAIRSDLTSQPSQQTLFALSLDSGAVGFVPAVGNGGPGDGGYLPMGTQPVVRTVNGQEVAYTIWRNGQICAGGVCDGREDATMGEMVLDGATVPGYQAGDVRFVAFEDIQTDETMYLTMSGDTLVHNHWLVAEARTITDRSAARGGGAASPIQTAYAPYVIWRQASGHGCTFNATTRYCTTLFSYGDTRSYNTPGFYEYWDSSNGGSTPFAIVSAGQVLVKTIDGALMVFQSGSPTAVGSTSSVLAALDVTWLLPVGIDVLRSLVAWVRPSSELASVPTIAYQDAPAYVDRTVTVEGRLASAVDRRPKAVYLGFRDPHDGALLVRVFDREARDFPYDPTSLAGKRVRVTGKVTLYWPEAVDPEIVLSDPGQVSILEDGRSTVPAEE